MLRQAADQAGIKFVMRVRRNACLSVARFCTRPIARNRKVRAAPCEVGSVACRILGTRQDVVRGKYYVFLTNATGSACKVASTYRRRWKVETWFRTLKHTLGFTNLQTTSTKVFRLYLDAIILAYSFHASGTTESLSVAADAPALSIRGEVGVWRSVRLRATFGPVLKRALARAAARWPHEHSARLMFPCEKIADKFRLFASTAARMFPCLKATAVASTKCVIKARYITTMSGSRPNVTALRVTCKSVRDFGISRGPQL